MSSSTSPPASSGTVNNLASSPTTSHNSIDSINSKEQDPPRPTSRGQQPTSTSPPTNPSAVTDSSLQQPDTQPPLPSLSITHPLSGTYPPPPSATASPAKPIDRHATDLAAREAKAHIRSLLREDWEWPSSTPQPECNAIDWRERDSDDEPLPSSPDTRDDSAMDNGSKTSRKRKRHTLLQDELHWNDGLRLWHHRRDCWAGARPPPGAPAEASPSSSLPSSSSSSPEVPDSAAPPPPPTPSLLLPVAPPLLPSTNPIRQSISHATYPAIYSKIVIQGLSPTVPINLADMVGACVMGWKKDGEWPPKPTQMDDGDDGAAAAAHQGRGRRLARRGVGRVKRVLGLGHGDAVAEAEAEVER